MRSGRNSDHTVTTWRTTWLAKGCAAFIATAPSAEFNNSGEHRLVAKSLVVLPNDHWVTAPSCVATLTLNAHDSVTQVGELESSVTPPAADRPRLPGIGLRCFFVAGTVEVVTDQLRTKATSEEIPVVVGDLANTKVDGHFTLVYLVFNTIGNLRTQDEQVECFRNAAEHLAPGGHFLIELWVAGIRRLPPG